jgi:hypothetical protein
MPLSEDAGVMITELNRSLRSWAGYYRISNASTDFKKVDRFTRDQVRIWLCRKYRERSRGRARWPSLWLYHQLGLHCLVMDVRSGARSPNASGEARRRAVCVM